MRERVLLVFCSVLLVPLAGFGGTSTTERTGIVTVQVELTTTITVDEPLCKKGEVSTTAQPCSEAGQAPAPSTTATTQSFSLTCNPTGGTLPLAAHVCDDIKRHPGTMLNPDAIGVRPMRHICGFLPGYSRSLTVTVTRSGTTDSFSGATYFCGNESPLIDASAIYLAAIGGNEAYLTAIESGLRCLSDRAFLCVADIGLGTHYAIAGATQARALNPIRPLESLFPFGIGTQACRIPVGRPISGKLLSGRCSVDVQGLEKPSSMPTVVFSEMWPLPASETASHTWLVLVDGFAQYAQVVSVTQNGAVPPQLWRKVPR
jgi:hypothetical protein